MNPLHRFTTARLAPALLALLLAACSGGEPGAGAAGGKGGDAPVPVTVAAAELKPWQQPVEGIANLRAQEAVLITAPVAGRVTAVQFREGARVAAGAPLVQLEDTEERAEYNAAKTNLDLQQQRFTRSQELRDKQLLSQDEFDAQAQTLKDAQARVALARAKLDKLAIRAPFAGVLGFRQVSPGTLVRPGDSIVSLDAIDTLRAEFQVPESQLATLAAGSAVTARSAAYPGRIFTGKVAMIGSRVDETTRTVTIQARIDNRDLALKPGMLLTLTAEAKARQALFVPEAAVVPEGNNQFLWRVGADNTVERIAVTLGARQPGFVEITAGLKAGDVVVTEGHGNLRPGKAVIAAAAAPETPQNPPAPVN